MLPNLLIVGAQKCGTSWLHAQLARHPDVFMSAKKELSFFNRAGAADDPAALAVYERNFDDAGGARLRGESTPHYFWTRVGGTFSPPPVEHDTPAVIRRTLGDDLQTIVMLRDPVSRAVSGYHHNHVRRRVPVGQGILQCPTTMGVVDLGFYSRHWAHWSGVLGPGMKAYLYDDLAADGRSFLGGVIADLGLPDTGEFWSDVTPEKRVHVRRTVAEPAFVSAQEIAALHELYRDEIEFVEELTGRRLPAWRDLDDLIARNAQESRPALKPAPGRPARLGLVRRLVRR